MNPSELANFQFTAKRFKCVNDFFTKNVFFASPIRIALLDSTKPYIENRLKQSLLSNFESSYKFDINTPPVLNQGTIRLGSYGMIKHHKFKCSLSYLCKSLFTLSARNLFIVIELLKLTIKFNMTKKNNRKSTIFLGIPTEVEDISLIEFINKDVNHKSDYNIIQSGTNRHSQDLIFNRFPLLKACELHLDFFMLLILLLRHLLYSFYSIVKIILNPSISLLHRDLPWVQLASFLNKKEFINEVIITNSLFLEQSLWTNSLINKHFSLSMLWYSVNIPPLYWHIIDGVKKSEAHPGYSFLNIDNSYSWFSEQDVFFKERFFKPFNSKVIGCFYFKSSTIFDFQKKDNDICITLFDVTPINNQWCLDNNIPYLYYNENTMSKFVSDVLKIQKSFSITHPEKNVRIFLKHKREYTSIHDIKYIQFISSLISDQKITILPENTNLHQVVIQSDLTISIPFTSTAYISEKSGVPAIFYDPNNLLENQTYYSSKKLLFICNITDLHNTFFKMFS